MNKKMIVSLAATSALLFLISIPLGSSGVTEGDPDTAQQIANVLFPLSILLALVVLGIVVVSALRLRSQRDPS